MSSFTARKKIVKERGAEPDAFEQSVAQVREHREESRWRARRPRRPPRPCLLLDGLRAGGLCTCCGDDGVALRFTGIEVAI
jgi:hypothetical protein